MASVSWNNASGGSWSVGSNWSTNAVPGSGDDAFIAIAGSYTVSLTATITVASLTISDAAAVLQVQDPGGNATVSGTLDNGGSANLDSFGAGGSTLTVGGSLTNGNYFQVGNGGMTAASLLSVGATFDNTGGVLDLFGGQAGAAARMQVAGAAPGTLVGTYSIVADAGGATLQFGSGQVGTIASGAVLLLDGANALLSDASDTTTDSALDGLTDNIGTLRIVNGASVAIAGNLLNAGALLLDGDGFSTEGGSTLTVAGTLTDAGSIAIGPPSGNLNANDTLIASALTGTGSVGLYGGANQANLDIAAAAPVVLAFNLSLFGHSLLQYGSGQIGTIASSVALELDGPNALVADASATTNNSALTGLAENDGTLRIINGASVGLTGNFLNAGGLLLDGDGFSTEGGSTLTVAGTLTNTGFINIGPPSGNLSANTTLIASALTGTGSVGMFGGGTAQAVFDIAAAAPAVLAYTLSMFGHSLLEYGSGEIGTIASGVSLELDGPSGFVADASDTTSNSALTGLAENDGTLRFLNGASVGLTGNFLNAGGLLLDGDGFSTEGGSTLTVAGTLTITDAISVGPPSGNLSANTTLIAAALTGTGSVGMFGGGTAQAVFDIAAAAPAVLAYNVSMFGHSLLQYGSGQIGTIARGVALELDGPNGFVADASAITSNSALSSLADNAGTLRILNGASVGITGNFLNAGGLLLDGDGFSTEGGSTLTVAGTLTNTNAITVGPPSGNLTANTTLIAAALTGTGSVGLFGGGTAQAVFDIAAARHRLGVQRLIVRRFAAGIRQRPGRHHCQHRRPRTRRPARVVR